MTDTTETATEAAEADDATEAEPALVWLDPTVLAAHPCNVRTRETDARDLEPSVGALGVLQPPVVVPVGDDGWQILAGHRRIAAAIAVGLDRVQCLVREDLAADARAVAAMLVENLRREDLTPMEEAHGYQQLLDLGMSQTRIAKTTGSKRAHVQRAVKVARSESATSAVEQGLTLEQALVVTEFEDDPEAVAALVGAAVHGSGHFRHMAARLREDREAENRRAAAVQALVEAGVQVLDPDDTETWPPTAAPLWKLTDEAGDPLDPEAHSSCPGHAVVLDRWDPERHDPICTDPDGNGHQLRWGSTSGTGSNDEPTEEEREAQRAERRKVLQNNKAWRAAETVRREWLTAFLNRKRLSKADQMTVLRIVAQELMAVPSQFGKAGDSELAKLLGREAPQGAWGRVLGSDLVAEVSDDRLVLVLMAQVAADYEHRMDVHVWRQPTHHRDTARWLWSLASLGYVLSDIEQQVVDTVYRAADDSEVSDTAADGAGTGDDASAGDSGAITAVGSTGAPSSETPGDDGPSGDSEGGPLDAA